MIAKIWKVGSSLVIAIPEGLARAVGLKEGDHISIPDDRIEKVMVPLKEKKS